MICFDHNSATRTGSPKPTSPGTPVCRCAAPELTDAMDGPDSVGVADSEDAWIPLVRSPSEDVSLTDASVV